MSADVPVISLAAARMPYDEDIVESLLIIPNRSLKRFWQSKAPIPSALRLVEVLALQSSQHFAPHIYHHS